MGSTKLGKKVATLAYPAVFGEQGLLQAAPRNASIKCTQDTEFLVVDPTVLHAIREDLKARAAYFAENLPGFKNVDGGASHPSVLFETVQMRKGDALMFQGILPSEPAIFMINEGTVDFRRYATASANPTYSLAIRPLTKSSWAKTCSRPKAGVAGACENKGGDDPFKQQNGFEQ